MHLSSALSNVDWLWHEVACVENWESWEVSATFKHEISVKDRLQCGQKVVLLGLGTPLRQPTEESLSLPGCPLAQIPVKKQNTCKRLIGQWKLSIHLTNQEVGMWQLCFWFFVDPAIPWSPRWRHRLLTKTSHLLSGVSWKWPEISWQKSPGVFPDPSRPVYLCELLVVYAGFVHNVFWWCKMNKQSKCD